MKHYYAKDFIDAYRMWAKSDDINDLSGRISNAAATRLINERIVEKIGFDPSDILVDVGCGDGTLLLIALARGLSPAAVIGILPTTEEVQRVRGHISSQQQAPDIVHRGTSDRTGIADGFATKCICNSVLHALPNRETIVATVAELSRITKSGGTVFIGELPDTAMAKVVAMAATPDRPSLLQRVKRFVKRNLVERFDRNVQVVVAPSTIAIQPDEFEAMAANNGLRLVDRFRSVTLSPSGEQQENPHRWDYVFERA